MRKTKRIPTLRTLPKHFRGRVLGLCALTLLQSLLQVLMALLTRFVIDSALAKDGKLTLWAGILALDVLVMVAIHALHSWLSGSTIDKLSAALRKDLLRNAAYSRDLRLEQFHSGQLLSRAMEDVAVLCDGMIVALPGLVGQLSRLLAAFAAVLLISVPVALVLAAAAVVVGLLTALIRPVLKKHHRRVRAQDEQLMAVMQEDLQQLELIQSLGAQEKNLERFGKVQDKSLARKRQRRIWSVGSGSVMNVVSLLGSAGILLWGAGRVAAEAMTYGALSSMIQLFALFRGPALSLSGLWTRLAGVEVAAERLKPLLEEPEKRQPCDVADVQQVVFENVTFCYPGDREPVLVNFSAGFPVDGWACLTGISGKGKTTLFKLILGLYAPSEGRVYLRTSQGELPCSEETRHLFAYVPQDYALFSGTVRENMRLVSDADEETRKKALEVAQADFLWEMPQGEDTLLGENNTGLSKGQLQRLAIARAILMERRILLLDECTSALDAETEAKVLCGLHEIGKQAILVTHRPDALQALSHIQYISI